MSFLGKIKNIFEKEEPEAVSLEKAMDLISIQSKIKESGIIEKSYKKSMEILSELNELIKILEEFKNKEVEEERAAASKDVKDNFCSSSIKELQSIKEPQKKLDEIEEFLKKGEEILNGLGGLTPKRTMHIRFFFKDDFRTISKKATETIKSIKDTRESIFPLKQYKKFEELQKDITNLTNEKEKLKKEKESVEIFNNELNSRLEEKKEKIKKVDDEFSTLVPIKQDLEDINSKMKLLKQEIDSFLSIEKLLKKFKHDTDSKDILIDEYIQSPNKAILIDKDLSILEIVSKALELIKKEENKDEKRIEKAENIVKNKKYLAEKRKLLLSVLDYITEKEKELEKRSKPLIEKASKLRNEESVLKKEKEQRDKNLEDIIKRIEAIEKEKKIKTESLSELTKELSPSPIEQYPEVTK